MFRGRDPNGANVERRHVATGVSPPLLLFSYRVPAGHTAEFHMDSVPGHGVGILRAGAMQHTWINGGRMHRTDRQVGGMMSLAPSSNPQTIVWEAATDVEWMSAWCAGDGLEAVKEAEGMRGGGALPADFHFHDATVAAILWRLFDPAMADDPLSMEQAASDLAIRLLLLSGARLPERRSEQSVFLPTEKRRLIDLMQAPQARPPDLATLASSVGLSRSQLVRKFRRSFGVSPARYVMTQRIQRAVRMLSDPEVSLASAALDLGFSSQSHFTRAFRAYTGRTPGEFQRQLHRAAAPASTHSFPRRRGK